MAAIYAARCDASVTRFTPGAPFFCAARLCRMLDGSRLGGAEPAALWLLADLAFSRIRRTLAAGGTDKCQLNANPPLLPGPPAGWAAQWR
jgi:hypothetical protein